MILANAILGLEPFGTAWWIVACIVCVILLISIGIAFSDSLSRNTDEVVTCSFIAIIVSVFWPIVIALGVGIGIIAIPIYLGKRIGNWAEREEKKQKEKEKFMNQIDKMKKTKGVD
jgi:uncharacterized membrane protein SirB2